MRGKRVVSDPRARDKPCLRCGYSLRKLEETRNCPECGLPIWISLNGNDGLQLSNPRWLRRISLACAMLGLSQALWLGMWVVLFVLQQRPNVASALRPASVKGLLTLQNAYLLVHFASLFVLATPEHRYPDRYKAHRWALLGVGAIGVAVGAVFAWVTFENALKQPGLPRPEFWRTRTSNMSYFAAIVAFTYLRRLALRGPKPRVGMWCMTLIIVAAMWLLLWMRAGWLESLRLDLLNPMFLIASGWTYFWFWRMFRDSAREAEAAWGDIGADGGLSAHDRLD